MMTIPQSRGELNPFFNPRLSLQKVRNRHDLPMDEGEVFKKVPKSNPRLAQIPTFNPQLIWGSGVFNMALPKSMITFKVLKSD